MQIDLVQRFRSRQASVAVIGLGYVGLPLALAFAQAGHRVVGIDVDASKVEAINRGESYIADVSPQALQAVVAAVPVGATGRESVWKAPLSTLAQRANGKPRAAQGSLYATSDYAVLAHCDAVSICVPTPLRKTGDPDISYIVRAAEEVARHLHSGMLIVLESTTYPGTTAEVVLPALQNKDATLKVGRDFFLCFSPERVDPGRRDWTTQNTPKVMGGITPDCLQVGVALYETAIETIVSVSSAEAAEMVKLLENTFRAVNIGMANEILLMCDKLGLNAWEVIEAAATKPFGFMKFTPGPGLGGHCIPIDPLYLSWKLKTLNYNARFIELAGEINTAMPRYWVQKVQDALNDVGKPLKGNRILILGVAYKKDVGDIRESPALDIILLLQEKGARVHYHDPHVASINVDGLALERVPDLEASLRSADCTVVVTDHSYYDWDLLANQTPLLIDTRHVVQG